MRKLILLLLVTALTLTVGSVAAQDDNTLDSDGVVLAIYNQGTALVRDRRTLDLDEGPNQVDFTDVASGIDATSVTVQSLTDPEGTTVLEQNYVFDLVDVSVLLERYLDETIEVITDDGNIASGQLLSGRAGTIILREDSGEVVAILLENVRDIRFPELPGGLVTRPTLRWLLNSAISGEQQIELTYLTGGINWTADYNILLGTSNDTMDINGWVTLTNTSGTSYENATVKLVAGDVNRLPQPQDFAVREEAMVMMADAAAPAPQVEQREFFEYQLYEVTRDVTVGDNETKQVEFVSGANVPANTFFVYDGSPQFFGYGGFNAEPSYGLTGVTDVQNYIEFSTGEEDGLGADLPAGRVRVYQEDVDGAALLIGENRIDHTPEGEEVELYLGNAFDLVGERIQTNFNRVSNNVVEETFEIRLRNRKDAETVEIRVPERLTRWSGWEIVNASTDFTQTDAFGIEFRVDVPPGEEVVITYTVRYTF